LKLLGELMPKCRGIRRLGSAALDLAYTACGRFDAFFEYSLAPWDVAAGAFIVEEAGGIVTDFTGGDNYLYGKEIIATNRGINKEMSELLMSHFKA
jgi:myo-inositol-1(or 4)-monophosphatase